MFINFAAGALIAASLVNSVVSECANACNGHGKCTAYDMCICNRNYQGNDCSQRKLILIVVFILFLFSV